MNSKTLRYLMKHSDIGVLLIHTHLGLEDAKEELKKAIEHYNSRDRRFGGVKEGEK